MSVLISCQEISKSYSVRVIFEKLSFGVFEGDKVGIVGPNGAGKSTFLKVLAGRETVDEGNISWRNLIKMAFIEQDAEFDLNLNVREVVTAHAIAQGVDVDDALTKAEMVLSKLGFNDSSVTVKSLSGGWRKRLSFACGLVADPDVVFLDEPTNHLDIEGVLWLEKLLKEATFSWVMVSHDRAFLQNTVKKVVELNRIFSGGLFASDGNFETFLARKDEFLEGQAAYEASLANRVRREEEWLRQGVKARTTKAKSRIDEAGALIEKLAEARSRKLGGDVRIDFSSSGRKTRQLLVAQDVQLGFGSEPIVDGLSLVLSPGMALGVLGPNGSGKSTILKAFAGQLMPQGGTIQWADQLKVVYFDQNREQLDSSWTLKRALSDQGDSVVFQGRSIHVASWARRFQFSPEQLDLPLAKLSGGERARLLIARLMLQEADILLLDEPTNDLDIATLEILEDSLVDFKGALVLVTHDRFMLERVCNLFIGIQKDGAVLGYAEYNQWEREFRSRVVGERANSPKSAKPSKDISTDKADAANKAQPEKAKRLSYMEQREYDAMEAKITDAEGELEECRLRTEDPNIATNAARLREAFEALQAAQVRVEQLYARWAELESKTN